jgi:predicted nucleotidyltransferase
MQASDALENPALEKIVTALKEDLGDRLRSIVLYGSAARGDFQKATSDINLLVVIETLDPETLAALSPSMSKWRRDGQPFPRFFTPELIAESTDVFPIEYLDIRAHHRVLFGPDPFEGLSVHEEHLRLWCERELREKMMRLREAYIMSHGKDKALKSLLVESYSIFLAIFRGCLHLLGGDIPARNDAVIDAFCTRAELDQFPFDTIGAIRRKEKVDIDLKVLYAQYYDELTKAVHRVDRFVTRKNAEM